MKKFLFVIGFALGGYALGSAQSATLSTANGSTSSTTTQKAACCQKGGEAKACCAKDAKASGSAECSGHSNHKSEKAEAAPAAGSGDRNKAKNKTSNTTTR